MKPLDARKKRRVNVKQNRRNPQARFYFLGASLIVLFMGIIQFYVEWIVHGGLRLNLRFLSVVVIATGVLLVVSNGMYCLAIRIKSDNRRKILYVVSYIAAFLFFTGGMMLNIMGMSVRGDLASPYFFFAVLFVPFGLILSFGISLAIIFRWFINRRERTDA